MICRCCNMIIGYIRVSTEQQSMQNQKHKLLEYAQANKMIIDEFIELEISSKKAQKEKLLDEVFDKLKSGDTFICTELSRLGRNMLEILNLIEKFNAYIGELGQQIRNYLATLVKNIFRICIVTQSVQVLSKNHS